MSGPAAKTRTEAAAIITRLQFSGMTRASIAKQLGVSADTIKDIARGKSSGDSHLLALRSLHNFNPTKPATGVSTPGASPDDTEESPTQAITPSVDVLEAPQEPERTAGQKFKQGIKDALLGKGPAPLISAKQAKGGGGSDASSEKLVAQLVPTLALLLVIGSHIVIPARYAEAAPTVDHAAMMIKPLLEIMAEQLEATGELSPTQMHLLEFVIAVGYYGQFAWSKKQEIDRRDGTHGSNGNPQSRGDAGGVRQAPVVDARPSGPVAPSQPQYTPAAPAARQQPARAGSNGHSSDEVGKSNPFAELYKLDAIGRRQLGIG